MKKFKKLVAILGLATITVAAVGCGQAEAKGASDKTEATDTQSAKGDAEADKDKAEQEKIVVATVEGENITLADLNKELAYLEQLLVMQYGEDYKNNEEAMKYYKEQQKIFLDYLIESKLVISQADQNKIEVSDKEVEEQIEQVKANVGSEEAFTAALQQEGITLEEYSQLVKENLIISKTLEQVTKDVKVNEDEVKKYYDDNIAQYTKGAGANMAHILVATEDEAKKVKKEYEEGKSFEELAATYGTDGTKDQGGNLGFITYDSQQYDQDFLAGAKNLKEGEVSDPVKTQFGYHLIKVTDVQSEPVVTPFEEAKVSAEQAVLKDKQYNKFEEYIKGIREKANIEIFEDKLG
nr:peptidyl-prolyl cis-trans isomerase [uncultured Niameybacter sp.]